MGRQLRASLKWKQLCAETEAVRVKILGEGLKRPHNTLGV
jgi:hypothetical protein